MLLSNQVKNDGKKLHNMQESYEDKIISLNQQIQDDDQRIQSIVKEKVNPILNVPFSVYDM